MGGRETLIPPYFGISAQRLLSYAGYSRQKFGGNRIDLCRIRGGGSNRRFGGTIQRLKGNECQSNNKTTLAGKLRFLNPVSPVDFQKKQIKMQDRT